LPLPPLSHASPPLEDERSPLHIVPKLGPVHPHPFKGVVYLFIHLIIYVSVFTYVSSNIYFMSSSIASIVGCLRGGGARAPCFSSEGALPMALWLAVAGSRRRQTESDEMRTKSTFSGCSVECRACRAQQNRRPVARATSKRRLLVFVAKGVGVARTRLWWRDASHCCGAYWGLRALTMDCSFSVHQ
jgi:hypothetical protein